MIGLPERTVGAGKGKSTYMKEAGGWVEKHETAGRKAKQLSRILLSPLTRYATFDMHCTHAHNQSEGSEKLAICDAILQTTRHYEV